MHIVYTGESAPLSVTKSIFLAGPSPRKETDANWRAEAFELLEQLGFDGVVYAPIFRDGVTPAGLKEGLKDAYAGQVDWETQYLNACDIIVFWVPRDLKTLPAFTTNVEFGMWLMSGKIVLGYPDTAEKMQYLDFQGRLEGVPVLDTLSDTLAEAMARIGPGATRIGGERDIPIHLWKKPEFQTWYLNQKGAGNRLDGATVDWSFRIGKNKGLVFLYALHVDVWIASENRNKTNEVVIFRPDISAIVAVCRPDPKTFVYDKRNPTGYLMSTEVVLVREFRSPANNDLAMVREVPGGSSFKVGKPPEVTAAEEMFEETGLSVGADRFVPVGVRQIASTLSAHRAHVYAVELTPADILALKWEDGKPHGNEEDTERTYVEVTTLGELLAANTVDWANVGMIFQTLFT